MDSEFSPRMQLDAVPDPFGGNDGTSGPPVGRFHASASSRTSVLTPRQRALKQRVRLPVMSKYPTPATCTG